MEIVAWLDGKSTKSVETFHVDSEQWTMYHMALFKSGLLCIMAKLITCVPEKSGKSRVSQKYGKVHDRIYDIEGL